LLRTREPFGGRPAFVAYAPIMHGAFSLAVAIPESEAMGGAWELVAELAAIGVIGVAGMLAGLWFVARSIVRPIENLAGAARAVAAGDLAQKLDPGAATDEVRDLTTAFSRMTEKLRTHIEELRHKTAEKEWIAGELNAARTMQMAMVPRKFPAFPERSEIDIHGFVLPAREVGGDFCNFFFVDDRRLVLVVGDVAGKGVPAALFMAVTTTLLKAHAQPGRSPGEVVALTNRELFGEAVSGVFVTLVYALLDTATGELEFCNAGHHAPLIVKPGGTVRSLDGGKDVACAIVGDWKFSTQRVWLAPGDTVVFYTDGVTEAMDGKNQLFSAERLEAELSRFADSTPVEVANGIVNAVRKFAGGREQNDDIGVLVLRWVGRVEMPGAVARPAVPAREPREAPGSGALFQFLAFALLVSFCGNS
jgi:sigma-B regulation protein RsbU (phosphoserine phosphatase)